jgi:chorismate-pyruvate lyase
LIIYAGSVAIIQPIAQTIQPIHHHTNSPIGQRMFHTALPASDPAFAHHIIAAVLL